MNKYIQQFFQLRCAGDVINAVTPVQNMAKEITEAMAIQKQLRKLALRKPNEYFVYDLCAGNALAGILAVFTLPIRFCVAVDIKPRNRLGYETVKKWRYIKNDIITFTEKFYMVSNTILISSHPCKTLARRIVEIYNSSQNVEALIMIPCCVDSGDTVGFPRLISEQSNLSKYDLWCLYLMQKCEGEANLFRDTNIASPVNNVIWARKEKATECQKKP